MTTHLWSDGSNAGQFLWTDGIAAAVGLADSKSFVWTDGTRFGEYVWSDGQYGGQLPATTQFTSLSAYIQKTQASPVALDSFLRKSSNTTSALDAFVRKARVSPLVFDALLVNLRLHSNDLDVLLRKAQSTGLGLEAFIARKPGALVSLDLLLRKIIPIGTSLDAILTNDGSLDATTPNYTMVVMPEDRFMKVIN